MIVPDYAAPAAVLVPHFYSDLTPLLEEIAVRTARTTGVILLTREPALTEAFLAVQPDRKRYRVVTAPFDSPWLRDRAPVAVRTRAGMRWFVPRYRYQGRPRDNRLFWRILARGHPVLPVPYLPGGNLVVGARGLVFVSRDVLRDNGLDEPGLHRHGAA
ncbi:MAG: hypothetical protein D6815_09675, partial [Candidatus Dadabacteria bacterium]